MLRLLTTWHRDTGAATARVSDSLPLPRTALSEPLLRLSSTGRLRLSLAAPSLRRPLCHSLQWRCGSWRGLTCAMMLKVVALALHLLSPCSADYTKVSWWPNTQCNGAPSAESFNTVGNKGCVYKGASSEAVVCTNSSHGVVKNYASIDCSGPWTSSPFALDPACVYSSDAFGPSARTVCVSTGASSLVVPSAAAPDTILYKSYLVDSCARLSPQALDYFFVISTSACIPASVQVSGAFFCNASGTYSAAYGPGCTGPPTSAFRQWEPGCAPDEERNRYFVADVSCYTAPQAQTSRVSAVVLGGAIGGGILGLGLLVGGVLLWRSRLQDAPVAEKAPLIFLSQ